MELPSLMSHSLTKYPKTEVSDQESEEAMPFPPTTCNFSAHEDKLKIEFYFQEVEKEVCKYVRSKLSLFYNSLLKSFCKFLLDDFNCGKDEKSRGSSSA